jgi:hypothetical protein
MFVDLVNEADRILYFGGHLSHWFHLDPPMHAIQFMGSNDGSESCQVNMLPQFVMPGAGVRDDGGRLMAWTRPRESRQPGTLSM